MCDWLHRLFGSLQKYLVASSKSTIVKTKTFRLEWLLFVAWIYLDETKRVQSVLILRICVYCWCVLTFVSVTILSANLRGRLRMEKQEPEVTRRTRHEFSCFCETWFIPKVQFGKLLNLFCTVYTGIFRSHFKDFVITVTQHQRPTLRRRPYPFS